MRKGLGVLIAGLTIAAGAQAQPSMRAEPTAKASPAPAPRDPTYGLPGAPNERVLRAQANLAALLDGRIFTSDLSPLELQDVLDLQRLASGAGTDDRSFKQRCIDEEVRRNGGNPTRLAWEVIRLKCR